MSATDVRSPHPSHASCANNTTCAPGRRLHPVRPPSLQSADPVRRFRTAAKTAHPLKSLPRFSIHSAATPSDHRETATSPCPSRLYQIASPARFQCSIFSRSRSRLRTRNRWPLNGSCFLRPFASHTGRQTCVAYPTGCVQTNTRRLAVSVIISGLLNQGSVRNTNINAARQIRVNQTQRLIKFTWPAVSKRTKAHVETHWLERF